MFTQELFLRIDHPDECFSQLQVIIKEKLKEMGYEVKHFDTHNKPNKLIKTGKNGYCFDLYSLSNSNAIYCGTNVDLFFALAALRDDTDKYQFFVEKNAKKISFWYKSNVDSLEEWYKEKAKDYNYRKVTADELITYFKTNQ